MNTRLLHNRTVSLPEKPQGEKGESQLLTELRRALILNRETQQKLKVCRDAIHTRMTHLDEFITSYNLREKFPPANALLSYIKFQRNLLVTFKDQQRITAQTADKPKADEDTDFMRKLNQVKPHKKKRDLSMEDLPKDPKLIDFLEIHKGTQFKCGLEAYRAWVDFHHIKEPKKLFTLDEDQLIAKLHIRYGENWEKISPYVPTHSFQQIYYEYHNRINPNLATGRWTVRQTLMLIILLEHFGAKKWGLIAQKMKNKSQLQVRERYCNLVDPTIGKDVWTYDLQKLLLEIAEDYGYCWKKISEIPVFKNKTDNCIWRKYKLLMIRFTQEEILEMLPPEKAKINRGLADKIIKEKRIVEKRKRSAKNKPQPPIYYKHYKPKQPSPPPTVSQHSQIQARQVIAVPRLLQEPAYEQMDEEVHFYGDNSDNGSMYRGE